MIRKRRNVQQTVVKAMQRGLILTTEKVKPLTDGGKQVVTVGPRRTAIPDGCPYQMICWRRGGVQVEDAYRSAQDAARDFVAFIGRDGAWRAAQRALTQAEREGPWPRSRAVAGGRRTEAPVG